MALILIIEETRQMAEAAAKTLIEAGYEADWCLSVPEAVSICYERSPDMVITEYYLSEGTGLDFLAKAAKFPSPLLTLMCTGYGNEQIAAEAFKAGVLTYCLKDENYLAELPGLAEKTLAELRGRKLSEEKDKLKRRLEAQNEMAEWMAHNFKNILAASIGYLNLINFKDQDQTQEKREEYLNESRANQESAVTLLEQLIRMTDTEGGEAERTIVAEVVDEAWEMAKSRVLIHIQSHYPDKLADISSKIQQIAFFNSSRRMEPLSIVRGDLASIMEALLQNALEAILAQDETGRVLVLGETKSGFMELTVRDNGCGMNESVLKHAVEPLFSTKGEVGVGLSLSLVSSLALRHGGELDIKSTKGAGTTVKVTMRI